MNFFKNLFKTKEELKKQDDIEIENILYDNGIPKDIQDIIFKHKEHFENNKQRGRRTCYSMYLSNKRLYDEIQERFPTKSFGEIAKERGKIWRAMSKEEKDKYHEQATKFNDEYLILNNYYNIFN